MRSIEAFAVFASLAYAAASSAQTNDGNFRGWGYYVDATAPRAAAMGGAFVAVTDDASCLAWNAAGLTTLTKTDLQAGVLERGSGSLGSGDIAQAQSAAGFVGGGGKLTKTIAFGAFLMQPHALDIDLQGASGTSGFLRTTVTDGGFALAWSPLRALHLGVRLNVTHLEAQGEYLQTASGAGIGASQASAQSKLTGDAGVLLRVGEEASLGFSFTQGARWDASRLSESLGGGAVSRQAFQISSPSTLRGGAAFRPAPRLLLTAEADYVFLARLGDTFLPVLQPARHGDYLLQSGIEARAGVEVSFPIRSAVSIQVRGGLESQAPAAFAFVGQGLPSGGSPFPGDPRRTVMTVGAGIETRAVHVDAAAALLGMRTVLTAGAGVRF